MDSRGTADFCHDALQPGASSWLATDGVLADASGPVLRPAHRLRGWPGLPHIQDPKRDVVQVLAKVLTPILERDSLPTAKILIARFKTIARILDASPEAVHATLPDQREVADKILAARDFSRVGWHEVLVGEVVSVNSPDLQGYLRVLLQNTREERVYAIFLDSRGFFLHDEIVSCGTSDHAPLELRRLAHRALDLQARKVILAHNHPSGLCEPSETDFQTTSRLRDVLAALAIELLDHLIIGGGRIYSMRKGEIL